MHQNHVDNKLYAGFIESSFWWGVNSFHQVSTGTSLGLTSLTDCCENTVIRGIATWYWYKKMHADEKRKVRYILCFVRILTGFIVVCSLILFDCTASPDEIELMMKASCRNRRNFFLTNFNVGFASFCPEISRCCIQLRFFTSSQLPRRHQRWWYSCLNWREDCSLLKFDSWGERKAIKICLAFRFSSISFGIASIHTNLEFITSIELEISFEFPISIASDWKESSVRRKVFIIRICIFEIHFISIHELHECSVVATREISELPRDLPVLITTKFWCFRIHSHQCFCRFCVFVEKRENVCGWMMYQKLNGKQLKYLSDNLS